MRFPMLIIDDEWVNREPGYKQLACGISKKYPSFEIVLDFLDRPDRALLKTKLYHNQYAAVITDAVLNGKWNNFTIVDVMEILDTKTPIAVVSSRWDDTNAAELAYAWKKTNCRTFLHWRDIELNGAGQIEYAIESVLTMIIDHAKLSNPTRLESSEAIRIVHISDVHTGGCDESVLKLEAQQCANAILRHWDNKPPTFVAFTGDVTEYGAPSQYISARSWITYFFKRLGLEGVPARNLLYVPGNHDVNLCLAAGSRVHLSKNAATNKIEMSLDDNAVSQPELIDYAYVPFRNFLNEICDCPLISDNVSDHSLAWVEARFRHLGVVFYGINTAQPANAFGLPGREVNSNELARIGEELGTVLNSCEYAPLVIGLGHHSPVAAQNDEAITNTNEFSKFFQGRVKTQLFLHGHSHCGLLTDTKINDVRLVRSCAPTFAKPEDNRPSDTLRGFNLLTLKRINNEVVSLEASSFGWLNQKVSETAKYFWELKDGMFREANI